MIIHWLLPEDKMGGGGGGRRDLAIAVLNCVSSKDFLRSLDRLQGS